MVIARVHTVAKPYLKSFTPTVEWTGTLLEAHLFFTKQGARDQIERARPGWLERLAEEGIPMAFENV